MREIKPNLTPEIEEFCGNRPVDKAEAFPIHSYRELVEQIAKLSFLNKDHLLFFRGQSVDHKTKSGASTFYPSIYRREPLYRSELYFLFSYLEDAEKQLANIFRDRKFQGWQEVARRRQVQWSILQHYNVCDTPLLDFTHSVRVACSFAQHGASGEYCYVYAFGLPYITNRISVNTEQAILNVRLLSICPPDAIRPYFQDGYLAGTEDTLTEYEDKTEMDFRNRLIAKFRIPVSNGFWGQHFDALPQSVLYPEDDEMERVCKEIQPVARERDMPRGIGEFLTEWADLEGVVMSNAREMSAEVKSFIMAQKVLRERGVLTRETFNILDRVRRFRNKVAHQPSALSGREIDQHLDLLYKLKQALL